jgi:hypothetical protein
MGRWFNLIQLGGDPSETEGLERAMATIGAPMKVHRLDQPDLARVYEKRLLLLRPDLHVSWRGDYAAPNPLDVALCATGHDISQ